MKSFAQRALLVGAALTGLSVAPQIAAAGLTFSIPGAGINGADVLSDSANGQNNTFTVVVPIADPNALALFDLYKSVVIDGKIKRFPGALVDTGTTVVITDSLTNMLIESLAAGDPVNGIDTTYSAKFAYQDLTVTSQNINAVPEPGSLGVLAAALTCLGVLGWSRGAASRAPIGRRA